MLHHPDGSLFVTGRSHYLDRDSDNGEATSKIYVRVIPEGFPGAVLAQLDTGAAWSIFDPEIAEALQRIEVTEEEIPLQTRLGTKTGRLARVKITLPAEEGEELTLEATIFLCDDWPRGKN